MTRYPKFLGLYLFLAFALNACASQKINSCSVESEDASGNWDVALYFDPPNPPSATQMSIAFDAEGQISGNFYGSDFETAKGIVFENEYAITSTTSDGSGPYIHSGRLKCDGKIYGQTLSTGRDFIMPWIATRERAS